MIRGLSPSVFLFFFACGGEPVAVEAEGQQAPVPVIKRADTGRHERHSATEQRLDSLEDRLARVELMLAQWVEEGNVDSTNVRYDPRATTLDARNVQAALDELAAEVRTLRTSGDNLGAPGPGLFRLPKDESEMMMGPQGEQAGARPSQESEQKMTEASKGLPPKGSEPGKGGGDGSAIRRDRENTGGGGGGDKGGGGGGGK